MINKGIAFICEGETESVFCEALIDYFCQEDVSEYRIEFSDLGEKYRLITANNNKSLIKMNCVSTISQITNSCQWLNNECFRKNPTLDWSVFLCYDTDSYSENITQFYRGDWESFRSEIAHLCPKANIIDLAARAHIEDYLLLDLDGIARFLKADSIRVPAQGKGKAKLKSIFREHGKYYHEGLRAEKFIRSLNLATICQKSPVDFMQIHKAIWG